VNKQSPVITWPAAGGNHLWTALSGAQLDATANVPAPLPIRPAAGTVLKAGTQTLSVTFTPTGHDRYTARDRDPEAHSEQGSPGDHLAAPQQSPMGRRCRGLSSMPRRMCRAPLSIRRRRGPLLTANIRTLTVKFTATDTTDYCTCAATKSLTVNKATRVITWPDSGSNHLWDGVVGGRNSMRRPTCRRLVYTPRRGPCEDGHANLERGFHATDTTITPPRPRPELTVNKAVPGSPGRFRRRSSMGQALVGGATRCDGQRPGALLYGRRRGTVLRRARNLERGLSLHRHDGLCHCARDQVADREQGNPGDHLAGSGGDHLLGQRCRDATPMRRPTCRAPLSITRQGTVLKAGTQT